MSGFIKAAQALNDAWDPALDGPTYPPAFPPFDQLVPMLIAWRAEVEARLALADAAIHPVDLSDPAAVRSWLTALTAQVEDIAAAAEDATRSRGRRRLGRAAARDMILEAQSALLQILKAAERTLAGAVSRPPGGTTTH